MLAAAGVPKNQGVNLPHCYGNRKLCSVLGTLMMLTHLIDQVQERCCRVFRAARQARAATIHLWAEMRACIIAVNMEGWDELMHWLIPETPPGPPPEAPDTGTSPGSIARPGRAAGKVCPALENLRKIGETGG